MARRARCNRAHSAITRKSNAIEEGKVNVHVVFLKLASGQLRFLGLTLLSLALGRGIFLWMQRTPLPENLTGDRFEAFS
jgi:hypothetical protein